VNSPLTNFEAWVDQAGYLGVFVVTLASNLGLPALGSAALVLLLRFLVSPQWWIAALVAVAGETVGQFAQYCAGRFGAGSILGPLARKLGSNPQNGNRFENFYRRYGSAAVFVCRFIPGVKSMSGFPAGLANMSVAPFLSYTFLGTTISCFALCWALHAAGGSTPVVARYIRQHATILFMLLLLVLIFSAVFKRVRHSKTAARSVRD
jgi:membrane protein DedA with SNARE-associated domain